MPSVRRILIVLLLATFAAPAASPADPGAQASNGTGLTGSLRTGSSSATLYVVEGMDATLPDGDAPSESNASCVILEKQTRVFYGYGYFITSRYDYACGTLKVTADALQDVTKVTGTLRSYIYRTKVKVNVTLRAVTPLLPYAGASIPDGVSLYPDTEDPEHSAGVPVYFRAEGGLRREVQVTGSITSSFVSLSKRQGRGYTFRSAGLYLSD